MPFIDTCPFIYFINALPVNPPTTIANTNSTMKMKNKTFAASADTLETLPNPKSPAIMAMIKNTIAHLNMVVNFSECLFLCTVRF